MHERDKQTDHGTVTSIAIGEIACLSVISPKKFHEDWRRMLWRGLYHIFLHIFVSPKMHPSACIGAGTERVCVHMYILEGLEMVDLQVGRLAASFFGSSWRCLRNSWLRSLNIWSTTAGLFRPFTRLSYSSDVKTTF